MGGRGGSRSEDRDWYQWHHSKAASKEAAGRQSGPQRPMLDAYQMSRVGGPVHQALRGAASSQQAATTTAVVGRWSEVEHPWFGPELVRWLSLCVV